MISEEEAIATLSDVTTLLSSGKIAEGKSLFSIKSSQFPESIMIEGLGDIAFYERDFQSSINHYEAAIRLNPSRIISRYQYLVGTQLERSGDLINAFKRYQASIEAEPTFIDAYVELGGLLTKVQDFEGAAQCYRDALKISPTDMTTLYNLKIALSQLVKKDSDRYNLELKDVEHRLMRLTQERDVKPIQDHIW